MCTVTVWRDGARLVLTMNRDEHVDRAPERPPEETIEPAGGGRWVAPRDGQAGGTWMGVSDAGLAACILNGYAPGETVPRRDPSKPSRGAIVPEFLRRPAAEAFAWIEQGLDPSPYPSFTLVALTPAEGRIVHWRPGETLEVETVDRGWSLRTSSALAPAEVGAFRAAAFAGWLAAGGPTEGPIPSYHLREIDGNREWSPMMTRTESATRSCTQAVVDLAAATATLRWWPRDPVRGIDARHPGATVNLSLTRSAAPAARRP